MVEHEVVRESRLDYGRNKFLEVSLQQVYDTKFINLTKGHYSGSGDKRYNTGFGFPVEVLDGFIDLLNDFKKQLGGEQS